MLLRFPDPTGRSRLDSWPRIWLTKTLIYFSMIPCPTLTSRLFCILTAFLISSIALLRSTSDLMQKFHCILTRGTVALLLIITFYAGLHKCVYFFWLILSFMAVPWLTWPALQWTNKGLNVVRKANTITVFGLCDDRILSAILRNRPSTARPADSVHRGSPAYERVS